jgi:zinc transporter ZupT
MLFEETMASKILAKVYSVFLVFASLFLAEEDVHAHSHGGHGHSHEGSHSHVQKTIEQESIHKRWVLYVIKLTSADVAFNFLDQYMRPLPFLAQSLLSTCFISIVPIFLIYFMNRIFMSGGASSQNVTNVLLSFAAGGLLGDVFFHTLPHLSEGHGHDHSKEAGAGHAHDPADMAINCVIVVGIVSFFLLEQITTHYFEAGHSHSHGN